MDSKVITRVNKKIDSVRIQLVGFRNKQFGSVFLMEKAYKQVMAMLNSCSPEEGEALLKVLHPNEVTALLDISNNGANKDVYVKAFTPYTKVRRNFKESHKSRGGLIQVSDEAKARVDASFVIVKEAIVEGPETPKTEGSKGNKLTPEEARAALREKLGFGKKKEESPKVEVEEDSLPDSILEAAEEPEEEPVVEEEEVEEAEEELEDPRAAFKRQMAAKMAGLGIGRGR